jgi:drug/metabolite transporter (DMT)-like permease
VYALGAMLFWGMSFVWTSILLENYQPVSIIFIRLVISSLFLYGLLYLFKSGERIKRSDYWLFFLSALFNPFFYFLGENFGLKYTTSTVTSVIIATIPLFSPLAAWISFREKLSWLNLAGIFVSFIGVLMMLLKADFSLVVNPLGILFLSGAVFAAIIYTVLLKKLSALYSPLKIIATQNLLGGLLFLPLFLIFDLPDFSIERITWRDISSILCLAILASSLSYVFFAKTVKAVGISKANVFTNLIPVVTAIFSFFVLSEEFSTVKLIGVVIVVSGVYISEINGKKSN